MRPLTHARPKSIVPLLNIPFLAYQLALLKRHFFEYERYQEVRTKEMMEARVDAVFESIRTDREFVALTHNADGRLPIPMKGMPATQATPNR